MRNRGTLRRAVTLVGAAAVISGGFAAPAHAASIWTLLSSPNRGTDYNQLTAVAARSAGDVWAVGTFRNPSSSLYQTLIEHSEGTGFRIVRSPNVGTSYNELNGVDADAPGDAWAVGFWAAGNANRTLVERWNGTAWAVVSSPNTPGSDDLRGVAALSPTDAWAVGDSRNPNPVPLAEHWDGNSWEVVSTPIPVGGGTLGSVAAISPTDVWAVGALGDGDDGALAEHWNGSAWSIVPTPALAGIGLFSSATAVGSSDVWAVGSQGSSTLTEHWDGSSWSIVSSPDPLPTYKGNNFLTAVTAVSSTDVWAVGATLDFTLGELEQTMTMRWDGTSWTVVNSPNRGTGSNLLLGAGSLGGGVVFAAGTLTQSGTNRTLMIGTNQR